MNVPCRNGPNNSGPYTGLNLSTGKQWIGLCHLELFPVGRVSFRKKLGIQCRMQRGIWVQTLPLNISIFSEQKYNYTKGLFLFTSSACTKMRSAAGLCKDPLKNLSSHGSVTILGKGPARERGKEDKEGKQGSSGRSRVPELGERGATGSCGGPPPFAFPSSFTPPSLFPFTPSFPLSFLLFIPSPPIPLNPARGSGECREVRD